jgi:hypothetical protein
VVTPPPLTLCSNDACRAARICWRRQAPREGVAAEVHEFKPVAGAGRCREFKAMPKEKLKP